MGETIRTVTEYEGERRENSWTTPEAGFQIVTDQQTITLAIDDSQQCCEEWGCFLSEQDTDKFIGAELRGVSITDTNLTSREFLRTFGSATTDDAAHLEAGDTLFVNIDTDRGVLQFVAYNSHNGYYGHEARVSSRQLQHEVTL